MRVVAPGEKKMLEWGVWVEWQWLCWVWRHLNYQCLINLFFVECYRQRWAVLLHWNGGSSSRVSDFNSLFAPCLRRGTDQIKMTSAMTEILLKIWDMNSKKF